jgi:hypothetical protein
LSVENEYEKVMAEISRAMLPSLKSLADWLETHTSDLDNLASSIGDLATAILGLFGLHSSTKEGQTKEAQASINFLGKSKEAVGKDVEYFRGFEKNWLGLNPESEQGKALWSVYLSNPQLNNLTEADKEKLSLTGNDKKTKDQLNALQAYGVQQDVYEKTGQVVDSRNWPKNF